MYILRNSTNTDGQAIVRTLMGKQWSEEEKKLAVWSSET